jgi:hypothetical protein
VKRLKIELPKRSRGSEFKGTRRVVCLYCSRRFYIGVSRQARLKARSCPECGVDPHQTGRRVLKAVTKRDEEKLRLAELLEAVELLEAGFGKPKP